MAALIRASREGSWRKYMMRAEQHSPRSWGGDGPSVHMTERTPVFAGAEDPGGARMQGAPSVTWLSQLQGDPDHSYGSHLCRHMMYQVPEDPLLHKQNTAFERGGKPQTS